MKNGKIFVDELDKQILDMLQEPDALTPKITEIAKKLGKSTTTVHSRIRRLEQQKVITGYTALLNPEKIGRDFLAFYFVKLGRGTGHYLADKVIQELLKFHEVVKVYNAMGEWDLVVEVAVSKNQDYVDFARKIEGLEGIKETKGKLVLESFNSPFKLTE